MSVSQAFSPGCGSFDSSPRKRLLDQNAFSSGFIRLRIVSGSCAHLCTQGGCFPVARDFQPIWDLWAQPALGFAPGFARGLRTHHERETGSRGAGFRDRPQVSYLVPIRPNTSKRRGFVGRTNPREYPGVRSWMATSRAYRSTDSYCSQPSRLTSWPGAQSRAPLSVDWSRS
jgi:hypothetical protein